MLPKRYCFKPTSEDWRSSFKIASDNRYQGGFVELSVQTIDPEGKMFRVAVWGNDDLGMIYDTADELDAIEMYKNLSMMDDIYRDILLINEFEYF